MSGTASIAVGILMIFLFGIGYIVGRCVTYDEKDNQKKRRNIMQILDAAKYVVYLSYSGQLPTAQISKEILKRGLARAI